MSEVKQYLTNRGELLCADSLQPAEVYRLVDAKDYDALAAKLAMAEDAAAKGDAARQQCGGMEMEIEELRAELETLRARVVVPDGYALMPLEPYPEMRLASHRYKRKNKVSTGPGFWRAMAEAAPRLNGKTVSEGLLRRLTADPDYEEVFTMDRGEALTELLDLLNQDKENGNG
ncbi:hypothetical protein PCP53_13480 [Pseudomonas aeruginosa]|uniref:hypothetical protein n=1 Tax=Pseudomonas aeruginosa TaxID=287 RepID=UPI002E2A54DB|nr:hypothetical protein [Pseudomonas aeruginosa]